MDVHNNYTCSNDGARVIMSLGWQTGCQNKAPEARCRRGRLFVPMGRKKTAQTNQSVLGTMVCLFLK